MERMKKHIMDSTIEQKVGTLEQAGNRYGFGRNRMREIAGQANAVIKIGKSVRVNFTILDKYFDSISGE